MNPRLPRDGRKCSPLYGSGLAFSGFVQTMNSKGVPFESPGIALGMRRRRPGAQPEEMDTFRFKPKGLRLRSGRDAFTLCAHLSSPSCVRAWVPQRLAMQALATPRNQSRCHARGHIIKPRKHEHLPGNQTPQLVQEDVFSCECVVRMLLRGPHLA
jgi:hypothetical protein